MEHTPTQQLDLIRAEWRSLRRSKASREAADVLRSRLNTSSPHFDDLGDVVELLEPGGQLDAVGRAHLVADLLEACPDHPLLPRALLQTLLPGIVAVARRLRWGDRIGDEPAVFLGDLITLAFEVITEWAGQHRPYAAPDILNALRCRMRRRLANEATTTMPLEHPDGSPIDPVAPETPDSLCSVEQQVREAAADDPLGAAALLGRELYGMTYDELAVLMDASPRRLAAAGKALARRISQ